MNLLVQFPTRTFRPQRPPLQVLLYLLRVLAVVVVEEVVVLVAAVLFLHISITLHTIFAENHRLIIVRRLVGRGRALVPPQQGDRPPHRLLPPPQLVDTLLQCYQLGNVQGGRVQLHMKVSILYLLIIILSFIRYSLI